MTGGGTVLVAVGVPAPVVSDVVVAGTLVVGGFVVVVVAGGLLASVVFEVVVIVGVLLAVVAVVGVIAGALDAGEDVDVGRGITHEETRKSRVAMQKNRRRRRDKALLDIIKPF